MNRMNNIIVCLRMNRDYYVIIIMYYFKHLDIVVLLFNEVNCFHHYKGRQIETPTNVGKFNELM